METEILYIHTNTPLINFKVVREALLIFLATKKPKDFSLHKATKHQLKVNEENAMDPIIKFPTSIKQTQVTSSTPQKNV